MYKQHTHIIPYKTIQIQTKYLKNGHKSVNVEAISFRFCKLAHLDNMHILYHTKPKHLATRSTDFVLVKAW